LVREVRPNLGSYCNGRRSGSEHQPSASCHEPAGLVARSKIETGDEDKQMCMMIRYRSIPWVALVPSIIILQGARVTAADEWVIHDVLRSDKYIKCIDLQIDAEGSPAIALIESWTVKYAWHDAGGWHVETVAAPSEDDNGVPFEHSEGASLAFDEAGEPCIAYGAVGDRDWVLFAKRTNGRWTVEHATLTKTRALETRLAVTSQGRPAVVFWDYGSHLTFTRHDGDRWRNIRLAEQRSCGRYSSLVIDATDCPRLLYLQTSAAEDHTYTLWYAVGDRLEAAQPSWRTMIVEKTRQMEMPITLALASDGQPVVAYAIGDRRDTVFKTARLEAKKDDDAGDYEWVKRSHARVARHTRILDMTVDAEGRCATTYRDTTQDEPELEVLHCGWYDGERWSTSVINGGPAQAVDAVVALRDGEPFVAFTRAVIGGGGVELKCATPSHSRSQGETSGYTY
jgi:hypothetical protein